MISNQKLNDFIKAVSSNSPTPGGGSVAAITAAQGAALTGMVAALTIGKKKYAEYDTLMREISAKAEALATRLSEYADKDTEAYNGVSAVLSMPKETDDEKSARGDAMQKALKTASTVPFEVMELCLEALKLTEQAAGKSNTNAASDLGVAALNLGAGVMGAWLNVKINLSGIKDEGFVDEYSRRGQDIHKEAFDLSAKIYRKVYEAL